MVCPSEKFGVLRGFRPFQEGENLSSQRFGSFLRRLLAYMLQRFTLSLRRQRPASQEVWVRESPPLKSIVFEGDIPAGAPRKWAALLKIGPYTSARGVIVLSSAWSSLIVRLGLRSTGRLGRLPSLVRRFTLGTAGGSRV